MSEDNRAAKGDVICACGHAFNVFQQPAGTTTKEDGFAVTKTNCPKCGEANLLCELFQK